MEFGVWGSYPPDEVPFAPDDEVPFAPDADLEEGGLEEGRAAYVRGMFRAFSSAGVMASIIAC